MNFISGSLASLHDTVLAVRSTHTNGQLIALGVALLLVCAFECVNGFHDTANAVATVIYTRTLRPWKAVVWSGICNFFGVILGGTAVAMGIIKLLPPNLLISQNISLSIVMVFALLLSAMIWNLGTWYLGIPSSSSHTLIGSILGIGIANAWLTHSSILHTVDWSKAREIGLALLISPIAGFSLSLLLQMGARKLLKSPVFHQTPPAGSKPPWLVRSVLLMTSSGVSFAHGSNDGQKGIGLVMLILIALFQGQFALQTSVQPSQVRQVIASTQKAQSILEKASMRPVFSSHFDIIGTAAAAAPQPRAVTAELQDVLSQLKGLEKTIEARPNLDELSDKERSNLRRQILVADRDLGSLEASKTVSLPKESWNALSTERKQIRSLVDYAPTWVIALVAISLGLGTMFGWKRVVVTVGEKIGKNHLTYAQGASAEIVAMGTIGLSAFAGLPVSTTHVLSSGVAGTMVAGRGGLQGKTMKSIIIAWLLTLPVSMTLSAGLFLVLSKFI